MSLHLFLAAALLLLSAIHGGEKPAPPYPVDVPGTTTVDGEEPPPKP